MMKLHQLSYQLSFDCQIRSSLAKLLFATRRGATAPPIAFVPVDAYWRHDTPHFAGAARATGRTITLAAAPSHISRRPARSLDRGRIHDFGGAAQAARGRVARLGVPG